MKEIQQLKGFYAGFKITTDLPAYIFIFSVDEI
jgi:hypothetical protein